MKNSSFRFIRPFLFALSLCVLVCMPTSLWAQLLFLDMSYAQSIDAKAYLCPPEILSSLFAQSDAKDETLFSDARWLSC